MNGMNPTTVMRVSLVGRCPTVNRLQYKSHRQILVIPKSAVDQASLNTAPPKPISLSDSALDHLVKLGKDKGQTPVVLRVGVKSGGCSGMSYVMDFEEGEQKNGDVVMMEGENESIEIRIDPKSLLYLFGLQLDYSNELIGGGFKFKNPNASSSCGCGTSFSV